MGLGLWEKSTARPAMLASLREGQRSSDPLKQAGHKTASDKHKSHQKCLAKQEPSTQDKAAVQCVVCKVCF
jgi:hypothetical protein